MCCSVLQCVAVSFNESYEPDSDWCENDEAFIQKVKVLQCVAVCFSVLLCVAVRCRQSRCCSVVQFVVVRCKESHGIYLDGCRVCCRVLQCAAVGCIGLQRVAACCSVLQRVAACCSVLQCVAVCCSVLQCVAVRIAS